MLRSMMYDSETQDKDFIAMMHDFVESHREGSDHGVLQSHRRETHDQVDGSSAEWPTGLVL